MNKQKYTDLEVVQAIYSLPAFPRMYMVAFISTVRLSNKARQGKVIAFICERLKKYHKEQEQ